MSELRKTLEEEVRKIIDEPDGPLPEFPIKPPEIETENIFDPDLEKPDPQFLEEMNALMDNPLTAIIKPLTQYFESIKPPMAFERVKSEHKVRIFQINNWTNADEIAANIEALLNEGYCCHIPTVVGDYVIMDFSRRKESEEDGRNT